VDDVYICELCIREFEPEEEELAEGGVRKLKTFKGLTVDLRLLEFRKAVFGNRLLFIPFNSPEGRKLLAQMHEEVMQQARKNLDDLERRLHISFEKFLKRLKQEEVTE